MADSPQPCPDHSFGEDQFHGNSPPVAGASWGIISFMAPHNLQSAPSDQPYGQPGPDDMFLSTNVVGNCHVDGDWEDMRPSVENAAAQDQVQNLHHHDHTIPDYARVSQDVPTQPHVTAPIPVIEAFNEDVQQAAASPTPAIFSEVPQQDPVSNGRASEVLRQLALLYLNDPNSQLVMIRMGPGHTDEVTVDFTLKLTNL